MPDLHEQLAAVASLCVQDLCIEWRKAFRQDPPRGLKRSVLIRAIAYKVQERSVGGLSQTAKTTLRKAGTDSDGPLDAAVRLAPGVRLVRDWGGQAHVVLVLESGFEYRGQRYRSLSMIAARVTGAHWSGPRFFGLNDSTKRGKRAASVCAGADDEP